jgi:poly(A) polymerase
MFENSFYKILEADPENIYGLFFTLDKSGVLNTVLPELIKLKGKETKEGKSHKDNFLHTIKVVEQTYYATKDHYLRLAAILHDIGKPKTKRFNGNWTFHNHELVGSKMIKKIFKRLELDESKLEYVENIVRLHGKIKGLYNTTDSALRRFYNSNKDIFDDLILFAKCDITTKYPDKREKLISEIIWVDENTKRVLKEDEKSKWRCPITGYDIMEHFKVSGKEIGEIKSRIETAIKTGQIPDTREDALKFMFSLSNPD